MLMKNNNKEKVQNYKLTVIICYVVMLLFAVALPAVVKTTSNMQYRAIYANYEIGEIAETSLYAKSSVDLVDDEATEQKRIEAQTQVLPIFSYSPTKTMEIVKKMDLIRDAFFDSDSEVLSSIIGPVLSKKLLEDGSSYILSVSYDIVRDICSQLYFKSTDISLIKEQGYIAVTVGNLSNSTDSTSPNEKTVDLTSSAIISSDSVANYISERLETVAKSFSSSQVLLLEDLIFAIVEPNVTYDEDLTLQRREEASLDVSPVVISITKGDLLIEANRVVNAEQIKLLHLLGSQNKGLSLLDFLGVFVLDAIGIGFGLYVFGMFLGRNNLHYGQFHILLAVTYVLSIIATYFIIVWVTKIRPEFIVSFYPIFFFPVFMTMASSYKRIGLIAVFLLSLPIATLPNATVMTFFYCILCGFLAVLLVRFFNKRIDMVYQWFFSCVICSAVAILFVIIDGADFTDIFMILLGVLFNVSAAYVLLSFTMPVVEKIFNLPTVFRLYELAYRDTPILTRLSQTAPGTYSHSRTVADLAEAGARAIGANALLARVGGLYHDIGKIVHPEYFVENQSGANKHDDISPSLSVAVIKSHVKVGADKGKEARLPPEVIKIIADHHGNDVIQYFYHEALESQAASQDNKGETVKASDYSYNANIPDFPECGIVMLADSIEAASRTVTPNAGKFGKLIETIAMGKIERGQLDNSGLTMHDIKVLSDSFVKTLVARYHSRIEYPDDDDD